MFLVCCDLTYFSVNLVEEKLDVFIVADNCGWVGGFTGLDAAVEMAASLQTKE